MTSTTGPAGTAGTSGTAPAPGAQLPPQRAEETAREDTDTRTLGSIVSDVSADLSTLMRQEVELAKVELKQEATRLGKGAGMLGGAGIAGHLMLWFLSLTLTFVLDLWLPLWAGALITAALWGVVTGVLAMSGKKNLQEAQPDLPETRQTLKEDVQWAKAQRN